MTDLLDQLISDLKDKVNGSANIINSRIVFVSFFDLGKIHGNKVLYRKWVLQMDPPGTGPKELYVWLMEWEDYKGSAIAGVSHFNIIRNETLLETNLQTLIEDMAEEPLDDSWYTV